MSTYVQPHKFGDIGFNQIFQPNTSNPIRIQIQNLQIHKPTLTNHLQCIGSRIILTYNTFPIYLTITISVWASTELEYMQYHDLLNCY